VPFQSADRYQASVVSSWFDVVIAYGDQYETLNYEDLVEIRARSESDLDVALKDPEYTLTRTIRKLAGSWRAEGELFAGLSEPVIFHGWMSPTDQLPGVLGELRGELETLLADKAAASAGLLQVEFADPEAGDGALAERLEQVYGLVPQVAGLLDPQPFWFYMVLESQGEVIQIPLPESLGSEELERSLDTALRRFTPGALNTVGVVKPVGSGPATRFSQLEATLADNARVRHVDLAGGQVPVDTDLLLVLAPEALDEAERFAIDQYLMRGGSVILTTSPFTVDASTTLAARRLDSGLGEWLAHQGIRVQEQMVLDPRNVPMPVPVERTIGGIPIREISLLDYPHFPDVRGDGLNPDNPATAGLGQLTLNWVSPMALDDAAEGAGSRHSEWLLRSSADSWLSDSLDILPDYQVHPATGYPVNGERGTHLLAVALDGRFTSFWQDKPSPLAKTGPAPEETLDGEETAESSGSAGPGAPAREAGAAATPEDSDGNLVNLRTVIERSPESARLVVIGSNSFASDLSLDLASQGQGTYYTQPLAFVQNLVDWALEDSSLLELRGRSRMARTLDPLPEEAQRFWEGLNYAMALVGLCLVWLWRRQVLLADYRRYRQILAEV
jgi:ABC-2 type transport system permease protein